MQRNRTAGKTIMGIAYGIDVKASNDPYIKIAQDALYAMNVAGNVGTYLVDFIPPREILASHDIGLVDGGLAM